MERQVRQLAIVIVFVFVFEETWCKIAKLPLSMFLSLKRCTSFKKLPDNQDEEASQATCHCHCFAFVFEEKNCHCQCFFLRRDAPVSQNCPITKMERQVRQLAIVIVFVFVFEETWCKIAKLPLSMFLSLKRCTSFTKLPDNQDGEASQATCHSSQSRLESRLVDWSSF